MWRVLFEYVFHSIFILKLHKEHLIGIATAYCSKNIYIYPILYRVIIPFDGERKTMNWLQKIAGLSDQALDRLDQFGYRLIDQAQAGSYELFLIYMPMLNMYQVGLQRTGLDFTDIEQQFEKQELPQNAAAELSSLTEMKAILDGWKSQYGELAIKSQNPEKDAKYFNILQWLGFSPSIRDAMGTKVIFI